VLSDATFLSIADRSILSCWGLRGGRAGEPFRVTIDPEGPNERVLSGLADDESVRAGEVVRIETTGGGGWGDPLERDPESVALDVRQDKVSAEAARSEYGVVLVDADVDSAATKELRESLRAGRAEPSFFDRGPGYARLSGGRTQAEVDRL
jgi:N-methylhydantoinase B